MKKLFIDFETTGANPLLHSPHSFAGVLIDGKKRESIKLDFKPYVGAPIEQSALDICKITKDDLINRITHNQAFSSFQTWLNERVDKFNKSDKIRLYGYNILKFDIEVLRGWFNRNETPYFGAYFHQMAIDVLPMVVNYVDETGIKVDNFKLTTIAKAFDLDFREQDAHDALFDVNLTIQIYEHIRKRTIYASDFLAS